MSSNNQSSDTSSFQTVFAKMAGFAVTATKTGTSIAKKGASATRTAVHSAADKVGLKDQVNHFLSSIPFPALITNITTDLMACFPQFISSSPRSKEWNVQQNGPPMKPK